MEDLYDLAHVPGWEPYDLHDQNMLNGLDLYSTHADPSQNLIMAAVGYI